MKSFLLIAVTCMCWTSFSNAQSNTFDTYRKEQIERFDNFRKTSVSNFENYRIRRNREFAGYLSMQWKSIALAKGTAAPSIPEPFVPEPAERQIDKDRIPASLPVGRVTAVTVRKTKNDVVAIEQPPLHADSRYYITVNFLGGSYKIHSLPRNIIMLSNTDPAEIARAWTKIATPATDHLVYDCQKLRTQLHLCDYAYFLLTMQAARTIFGNTKINEANLLAGYILAQSGLDFRYATGDSGLTLLLPFDVPVYKFPYYQIEGRKFYLPDSGKHSRMMIHMEAYSQNANDCRLTMTQPMSLPMHKIESPQLTSENYPQANIKVCLNKNLLDFYEKYPKVDWAVYAGTPFSKETEETISGTLRNAISNKSPEETVNILLDFVQSAFKYGYDDKIWGYDRPFFAEETLFYPKSDCEDRAILFSRLIKTLTDFDIVLLHYPNHLATAVRINDDTQGDYVTVNNKKYIVCDPTGHMPAGNAYDEFKNKKAKAILLD